MAGEKGRFDRLNALQPNQPGRALNLISKSLRQTDSIEEFLLDEKSALSSIQERLFVEHVDKIDTSGRSEQWNPFDWSLEMQLRIADVLAKTDDATGFASLMGRIESTVNGLVKSEQANNQLLVVLAYLQKDDMERAETFVNRMLHAR